MLRRHLGMGMNIYIAKAALAEYPFLFQSTLSYTRVLVGAQRKMQIA